MVHSKYLKLHGKLFRLNQLQMSKYYPLKLIYTFLLGLIFLSSCKGQSKTPLQSEKSSELKAILPAQTKLIKTQGSSQYDVVFCGIQDKQGNFWFGTTGDGVYKFDGKLFTQFTLKDGLSSNCVMCILEDKAGTIWFGTSNGICRIEDNKIIPIPISFAIRPVITDNSYYNETSNKNTVWSMMQDKSGKIWIGTGECVYYYDGKNFTRFLANDNVINKDSVTLKMVADILEDKNGTIWFASGMPPGYEGLSSFDGKTLKNFRPNKEGWFRNVEESKNGNLILASRHYGVWTYDASLSEGYGPGKSFSGYSQPKDLLNGSLNDILEDRAGNLWVASDYGEELGDTLGGLWYSHVSESNPTEKTFIKIFNKEVSFIFEDKANSIWFGTRNMGLYCYDRKIITKFSE
ncbi:MAG: hypothetical protein CFE21_01050 [Bacteroidetes bacterium B1(2017)]|nr:MAG: hypothetical protein CFE21_01050 [Bacteroidetes bacterium B1(2017)]